MFLRTANVSIVCGNFFEWNSLQLTDRREKAGHLKYLKGYLILSYFILSYLRISQNRDYRIL